MTENEFDREHLVQQLAEACAQNRRLESRVRNTEIALHEAEQRLQQAQKMETLGTLVAGVAHEINNPINLILYNLPLLQKIWTDLLPALISLAESAPERKFGGFTADFLKDNLAQLVADMEMAANRVTKIVADLKNFSRQSNIAEKHLLNINTAVKNALRLAQTTLRKVAIGVRTELAPDLPEVEGNLQSIEQVVLNIVINAAQAIDHTHGEILIQTGFSLKDGRVYLRVTDNGRGVSPAMAERVFLPFVTDKQAQGGTGLGLSVTYSIVQAHGGEIFFENREGGAGTAFTVQLPTPLKRRAAKILLVDDDPMVRQILMEALAIPRCYLLEEATNGIEASIRLGTYRPELLVLDVFMPEMDGVEVCRSIKTEPALAGMKVIITTGFPGHPKLDELAALGFTTVLTKPFNIPDLLQAVEKLLAQR
ncbi:MAG TPA: ATP-binding protein [Desulfobacterales bacterium]|nr:ATP-binding protein [Desulfobacterales bacterium]